ncbi:3'-5' exonuclease [Mitsuokella multacida]|jgi:inhibitor of KinA sporulation pathway (predicted exonuclease)|uniref:Exonuclease n=1 Tax=Mitsuokella multacida DSM 20544 TaxID=500635 RepID=C9KM96_9FIRM|nr:3'-5' exonuclease [Mitsuokella multacida]EEX69260.1 exonuclease [Mitsuokella multacida DSM 20544]MCF2584134.1 exonuclease domain-containing protein [Mitsuokella multacida]
MKHVVVDLEMNPVSREFREVRRKLNEEVIEIGAVRLDENFQQEAEFQCYVKPEYGPIKKHITSLTGITQAMVADKKTYAACFQDFVDWVGEEETKIYSWSMSDIKQLRSECRYKLPDFDIEWLNERWVDLQQEFDDRLGLHNSLALKHALGAMDHKFEGTQHTALADAINTSAILTLMQDDAKFKETMKPVLEILQPKDDLSSSIGDLCPELAKLQKDL